jgi:hypothetical protein
VSVMPLAGSRQLSWNGWPDAGVLCDDATLAGPANERGTLYNVCHIVTKGRVLCLSFSPLTVDIVIVLE